MLRAKDARATASHRVSHAYSLLPRQSAPRLPAVPAKSPAFRLNWAVASPFYIRPNHACHLRNQRFCPAASSSQHGKYQFNRSEFHRLRFCSHPYGPLSVYQDPRQPGLFNAVLGFQRDMHGKAASPSMLEVFLSGDSAINIYSLLSSQPMDRPMTHELMYTILEKSHSKCKLLWVAITELQNNIFLARAFFGDPATGEVEWDCDCRPSDGCFLAIKARAPLYVHKKVWDEASKDIQASTIHRLVTEEAGREAAASAVQQQESNRCANAHSTPQQQPLAATQTAPDEAEDTASSSSISGNYTAIRDDDLDEIKLLKQKLAVAVRMEDYAMCTRLRDHPWMQLYKEAHAYKAMGRFEDAEIFEAILRREVENNNAACRE